MKAMTNCPDGDRQPKLSAMQPAPNHSCNARVVQRLMVEVLGGGDLTRISELISPRYVAHLGHGDYYGHEGVRIDVATYRTAFPDLTVRLDDLFTCGNHVLRRFTIHGTHMAQFLGHPPTGERVTVRGMGIDRVADGRLQESWVLVEIAPRAPPARS